MYLTPGLRAARYPWLSLMIGSSPRPCAQSSRPTSLYPEADQPATGTVCRVRAVSSSGAAKLIGMLSKRSCGRQASMFESVCFARARVLPYCVFTIVMKTRDRYARDGSVWIFPYAWEGLMFQFDEIFLPGGGGDLVVSVSLPNSIAVRSGGTRGNESFSGSGSVSGSELASESKQKGTY